ncbi:PAS domain S-box protein [Dyadobacter sp. CY345]|uniref:PAS domain S-box protein n=1 Tax=Dyadobacter sp. CY345 TaxID=2909335 RepID=UPI001F3316A4|nr:PAS domain S-box protein [Dyadobacter sp. CY345]MCF2446693.1 PAS domain S-box protein [Dyadobacter sp. CY345]
MNTEHDPQSYDALLQSENQFRMLAALSSDALYKMSPDWKMMINMKGSEFLANSTYSNPDWFEQYIPKTEQPRIKAAIENAIAGKCIFELEHQLYHADGSVGWAFSRAVPVLDRQGEITEWFGTARDITSRKHADQRQVFLLEFSDKLRDLEDPLVIQQQAAHLLGNELVADRVLYAEVVGNGSEYIIAQNYLASPDTVPVIGKFPTAKFGQWLIDAGMKGQTMVVADVMEDSRITSTEKTAFLDIGLRAFITTPLNKEGNWVAAVKIHQNQPRHWSAFEISLVEEVAERTWASVQRAKAEEALRENEAMLKSQKEAFQAAINGASLEGSLDILINSIIGEKRNNGIRAAFYLVDQHDARVHPVYKAGNMPEAYLSEVERLGESAKDCLAVSSNQPVIINDVFEDSDWDHCLQLAKDYGFHGWWLFPIETHSGIIVGTFIMYFNGPRMASSHDLSFANSVTQTAAIIISRHNEVKERLKVVEALADSEKRLRFAIDATQLATWEWNLISGEVIWNEHHFRLLGMEIEEKVQLTASFLNKVHPDDLSRITGDLNRAIAENGLYNTDFRILRGDNGAVRWMSGYGRVTETLHGEPVRMSGVMFDITDRKQAEESLRQSEQRQRAILESAKDYAIITLDTDRSIRSWNAGAEKMMGYSEDEIIGLSVDIFFVPEDRAKGAPEHEVQTALDTGRAQNERWHMRKNGSRFYGSGVTTALVNDSGDVIGVLKVMRNLTAQKNAEQALQKSQERLQLALQIPTVGVLFFDEAGTFTGANEAFLAISGFSAEAVETRQINTSEMTIPEWMPRTLQALKELRSIGRSTPYEKQLQRPDGSRWWGLFAGTRLSQREYVEFVLDITHRKQAEEALWEADRRKDEFLALLAHELRNPMATLSNTLMILELTGGQQEILPLETALAMMRREMVQLVRLVDDLMDVSRINQGKIVLKLETLNLKRLVEEALLATRPVIDNARRTLLSTLTDAPLLLEGDATRLTQVVRNLLTNATKFTHEGGQIWIDLAQEGDMALLRVRDDGIGIPSDQLEHIFGLFAQVDASRTRSQGGLGLGLTLVREFIEKHGGRVEARSEGTNMGSEFIIQLPLLKTRT